MAKEPFVSGLYREEEDESIKRVRRSPADITINPRKKYWDKRRRENYSSKRTPEQVAAERRRYPDN